MSKKSTLQRPEDLEFELANGVVFIVAPYTRKQLREAIALDPQKGEVRSPAMIDERRAVQLEILVGPTVRVRQENDTFQIQPSRPVLEQLCADEEMQMIAAILSQGHGQDPAGAVALHNLAKKKALVASLIAHADSMLKPSTSPSTSGAR